jgi:hypothetical protein
MSRGDDSRTKAEADKGRAARPESAARTSRSSVPMTAERARAIQSRADRDGRNQDFKARAMAAAERNADADADVECTDEPTKDE